MPPRSGCPDRGPASPEVTRAICRVPSTPFARSPGYARPVHLCRFRVRSICRGCFLDASGRTPRSDEGIRRFGAVTSGGPRNLDLVPIGYGSRPRLRGRLTLRGRTLRRNPWTSGGRESHPPGATRVSIGTSDTSTAPPGTASQAYGTLRYRSPEGEARGFGAWLEPRSIFGAGRLLDQ